MKKATHATQRRDDDPHTTFLTQIAKLEMAPKHITFCNLLFTIINLLKNISFNHKFNALKLAIFHFLI